MMVPQKENYEFIAKKYDLILGPFLKSIRKKVIEISEVKKGTNILEVACGTGEQAVLFVKNNAIVTGLDISDSMLKVARQKSEFYKKTLKFVSGDATKMQFANNQFDISTITLAIHEMEPLVRIKVIKEMIRVTKKNGNIILVDYTIPESKSFWSFLCKYAIWIVERITGGNHYKNYRHFMKNGGLQKFITKYPFKIKNEVKGFGDNLSIYNLLLKK